MPLSPKQIVNPETGKPKFEFVAGAVCLDFCNTTNLGRPIPNERLKTYDDLVLWGQAIDAVDQHQADQLYDWAELNPREASQVLLEARKIRASLHRTFVSVSQGRAPLAKDITELNNVLARALAKVRIVFGSEGFSQEWDHDPLEPDCMLWPVLESGLVLLTGQDVGSIRQCSGEGCSWLFADLSRNHSRRWCSMEHCGNRMRVRRFYKRNKD